MEEDQQEDSGAKNPGEEFLRSIAGAVSDNDSVNWDKVSDEGKKTAPAVESLKAIASISDQFRAMREQVFGPDGSAGSDGPSETEDLSQLLSRAGGSASPQLWGHLELAEEVASGSYGRVFRAFDPILQRTVALKLKEADPDSDDQALAEARRLARVRHPNVLCVHGAHIHEGRVGIWTDLLSGHTLEERLVRDGPVQASEAAIIGLDLSRALSAVHAAGLVHGDLKAANVMREEEGTIVLLDFGSGRLLKGFDPRSTAGLTLTQSEESMTGTPLVLPPEAFTGQDPGIGADVYALGVLLYRLTTGEYPVPAETIDELRQHHEDGYRVPITERRPDLPSSFATAVEQALLKVPDRFASIAEMERALSDHLTLSTVGTGASSASTERCPNNLPSGISRFVGRGRQLVHVQALVGENRLVTLTGTGGCGKTRLAIQVASRLLNSEFEEVRLVELSALLEADQILPEIGKAFGLREEAKRSWAETIAIHLAERKALLLLDNCEHLLDACAAIVTELLANHREFRILATSRQALGIPGEAIHAVPPLAIAEEIDKKTPEELLLVESVSLFLDRAQSYGATLAHDETSIRTVARICGGLDGIPLAIELAAARVRTLSVEQIHERLENRFGLLTSGNRLLPRHQTLEAMIQWSHGLLSEKESVLFRRLAVFVGGWSLYGAEQVVADAQLPSIEVFDILSHLVDKSLVERDPEQERGEARFRMLETIRVYAMNRLEESGEREMFLGAHREYFAGAASRASQALRTPEEERWQRRLEGETQNLRAALDRCLEGNVPISFGLQFVADVSRIWFALGQWNESREYIARMLSRPGAEEKTVERFETIASAGFLAGQQGDWIEATAMEDEALEIALALDDKPRIGITYGHLGNINYAQGHCAEAMSYQEKSLEIARELGDLRRIGICLSNVGNILEMQGEFDLSRLKQSESLRVAREAGDDRATAYALCRLGDLAVIADKPEVAEPLFEESLALRRQVNDRWGISVTLSGLADVYRKSGEITRATPLYTEAAEILDEIGDQFSLAKVLGRMAEATFEAGEFDQARGHAERALQVAMGIDERRDMAVMLMILAAVHLEKENPFGALQLLGASSQLMEEMEAKPAPAEVEWQEKVRARAVQELASEDVVRAEAAGQLLTIRDAVEFALGL